MIFITMKVDRGGIGMEFNELVSIYPQAELHTLPSGEQTIFSFPSKKGYIWIAKEQLSPTEMRLLQHLSEEETSFTKEHAHPWYRYLLMQETIEVPTGNYRIIQVAWNQTHSLDQSSWLKEIRLLLPQLVDAFFVTNQYAILVEKQDDYSFSTNELAGLFLALDGDFDSYSRIFVGYFHPATLSFHKLFTEEESLFSFFVGSRRQESACDLALLLISYCTQRTLASSYLLQSLATHWFAATDLPEILTTLWKNQGNISSTAKELFMHRNTLQYKLDKFQQASLLNLKETNQLFLCQLLIENFVV